MPRRAAPADRANFITGQLPIRTGMTTVGQAAPPSACRQERQPLPALKALGYATGQFGKNHLGDRNEYPRCTASTSSSAISTTWTRWKTLPSELSPRSEGAGEPAQHAQHSWATTVDDPTVDPRWGKVGKQKIEDKGELCPKRMETVDDEIRDLALKFIDKAKADNKPFFLWLNPTRMHIVTHLSPKYQGMRNSKNGWSIHEAGMAQLDDDIDMLMKKLKDMGLDDNPLSCSPPTTAPRSSPGQGGGQTPFARARNGHGRWLPRAGDDPLAGQGARGQGRERPHLRARLVPDVPGRRRQRTSPS